MLKFWETVSALMFVFLVTACMPHVPHNIMDSPQALTEPPSADKAKVVFVGISPFPFAMYEGSNIIGAIAQRECMVSTVSPGKHLFAAFFKKKMLMDGRPRFMFIDSELDGGKIYYVLVTHHIIPFAGVFPDLFPIREVNDPHDYWKKLPGWLPDCRISVMNEETAAWNKEVFPDYSGDRDYDYNWWINDPELQKLNIKREDGVTTPVMPKR